MAKRFKLWEDFSLEQDQDTGNLNIDKVIKLDKLDKVDDQNLTESLIQQRNKLKEELSTTLKDQEKKDEESSDNDSDSASDSDSSSEDEFSDDLDIDELDSDEESKDDKEDKEKDKDSDSDKDKDESKDEDKEDKSSKDKDSESSDDKKEDEKVTSESFRGMFKPIHSRYSDYLVSLEGFNLGKRPLALEEQKVAYVKEDVIKSLNMFINAINKYDNFNKNLVEKRSKSLVDMDRKFTYIQEYQRKDRVEYTNELIKDSTFLGGLLSSDCKNIRVSIRTLMVFLQNINNMCTIVIKNGFESVVDASSANGFVKEENNTSVSDYEKILPGFNKIYLAYVPYQNYLKSNVEDYSVNRARLFKVTDLSGLDPIVINNKVEVMYLCSSMVEIDTIVSKTIETLETTNKELATIEEKIKALVYDINKNEELKLAELPIDDYIKKFLKLKYIYDSCSIALDIYAEFTSMLLSALDKSIRLVG